MKRPEGCGNHSCRVNPPKKGQQGTTGNCTCGKIRLSEYIQFLEYQVEFLLDILYTAESSIENTTWVSNYIEDELAKFKKLSVTK